MKLLLDTHVFLWLRNEPEKVSKTALDAYQSKENSIFLSLVSVWEIQIKQQLGKLQLAVSLAGMLQEQCTNNDLRIMPIDLLHILGVNQLPFHHKDPFDRLLISQAKIEELILVSSDSRLAQYDVKLLW